MREFFKPWRRKIGVVVLALALAFMAAWVRSEYRKDVVMLTSRPEDVRFLVSNNAQIGIIRFWEIPSVPLKIARIFHRSSDVETDDPFDAFHVEAINEWWGVRACEGTDRFIGRRIVYLTVSYVWLVAPLTFVSAWLLLIKPRPAKSPRATLPPEPNDA